MKKNGLRQADVASYLGCSQAFISKLMSGGRAIPDDKLALLRDNLKWDTSMLADLPAEKTPSVRQASKVRQIAILPQTAAAGYLSENNGADMVKPNEFISFVDFVERHADFAIRVDGDSMYPRYNNGDVLACRILKDRNLFDFGRIYVLNTVNGCIVKKVLRDPADDTRVVCHSENPLYQDYELSKSDILGVAVVVGHAGIE